MDRNNICSLCKIKKDVVNYKKDRAVCKKCYKKNKRKNNNNTSQHNRKSKLLMTITIRIEPEPSSDEVLELLEVIK